MIDPTYSQELIQANPVWQLAFSLSEIENDKAPLGWSKYIFVAECLLSNYKIKRKRAAAAQPGDTAAGGECHKTYHENYRTEKHRARIRKWAHANKPKILLRSLRRHARLRKERPEVIKAVWTVQWAIRIMLTILSHWKFSGYVHYIMPQFTVKLGRKAMSSLAERIEGLEKKWRISARHTVDPGFRVLYASHADELAAALVAEGSSEYVGSDLYEKVKSALERTAKDLNGGEYKHFIEHVMMPLVLGTIRRAAAPSLHKEGFK